MNAPIIVGGNGHSGTRLFAEILLKRGVFMGLPRLSYSINSKDLNIRGLMGRWMRAYLTGQADEQTMKRQFRRRIRLLIPFQNGSWGFKNPRAMFLLPMYAEMYPRMKFIHVIRDGRDMCFGNPFIDSPTYWGVLSEDEARAMTPEERMITFWGRSNAKVQDFGEETMPGRYLMVRFEDICDRPYIEIHRIMKFMGDDPDAVDHLTRLVHRPKSIGRWRSYPPESVNHVQSIGAEFLQRFGYA